VDVQATREAIGISRGELAAAAGVPHRTIESIEHGLRRPSPPTVVALEVGLLALARERRHAAQDVIAAVPLDPETTP
jgi:DNA-binding XRE family transcriptional regulator